MKLSIFIAFFILPVIRTHAQTLTLQWAKNMGSTTVDYGRSIAIDASGNVYSTGEFTGTVDFDPGPGVFNLSSAGSNDICISKLDANGNFLWAKRMGSVSNDAGYTIALDANGNVYTGGYCSGTVDFDPGPGVYNLSAGTSFISKLDPAGNFVWAKQAQQGTVDLSSIIIDVNNNVISTGGFSEITDFDPGPGVFNLTSTGYTGTITGIQDIFVLKLDVNGNFVWVKQMTGIASDRAASVKTDASGNIYSTGTFGGTVDFDPGAGIVNLSSLNGESFVSKLDANGSFVLAKQLGGGNSSESRDIAIDAFGNIYTVGYFLGTADFDPGPGVFNLISAGSFDIFLSRLDAAGNFVWAKRMGGSSSNDRSFSLSLDQNGSVYSTGSFTGTADFDPGPGIFNLTSAGFQDIFISKLDNSGNFVWAKKIGSLVNDDAGLSIETIGLSNIYLTGYFWGTVDFDPEAGTFNLTSNGFADIFVQKLNQCAGISDSTITTSACFTYTLNSQTYSSSGVYTQILINAAGCDSVITLNLTINGSNDTLNAVDCDSYTWNSQTYTLTGFYRDTLIGASGCDSIINLDLVIKYSVSSNINVAICQGQSYFGHTTSGTYIDIYIAANGCDSVRTLNLLVKPKSFNSISATICEGQNYSGHTLPGTYIDTLIAANGCDSIRTLNLNVNPRKFTAVNATICQGQSYFAGGANQTSSGSYKDTLISQTGCDSVVTTNLLVNPKPIPNLGPDKDLCFGKTVTLNPGSFAIYLWQDMSTLPNFVAGNTGIYWVTVTDNNNCSTRDSIEIKNILPLPSNFLRSVDSVCQYEKLQIQPLNSYTNYLWSTGSTQPIITVENQGRYILTVQDVNGCTGSDTTDIFQKKCFSGVLIPTAFTPNGDQLNYDFRARVYGTAIYFRLEVYDRAGQLVFRTTDPQKGWNGIYGGVPSTTSVFIWQCFYQLQGGNPGYQKGTVTVIR